MDFERTSELNEQARRESAAAPLRRVAVVVGEAPALGDAVGRSRLLPLAPGASVVPVRLAERPDARGRRRVALVSSQTHQDGDLSDGELAPELVLIGRGRVDVASMLFGSVAEKLARSAEQPVLVTRIPPERPYARVLVATDFSDSSADAVQFAARVVTPSAVRAWVLHAYDTSYALVLRVTNAPPEKLLAYRGEARRRAETGMANFLARHGRSWSFHPTCVSGEPVSEIRRFLRAHRVELLVLAKHAPSHPGRPMLGSVAQACLRRGPCDVLVVPGARPTLH